MFLSSYMQNIPQTQSLNNTENKLALTLVAEISKFGFCGKFAYGTPQKTTAAKQNKKHSNNK